MITPQQAVQFIQGEPQNRHKEIHAFVVSASARDLLQAVCLLDEFPPAVPAREWQIRIGMALDIKLAEDAERTAQKFITGTDTLIAETKTLVKITNRLFILTIVLIFLASFEFIKFVLGLLCHAIK